MNKKLLLSTIERANISHALEIAIINALSWKKAYQSIIPEEVLNNISVNDWQEGWRNHLEKNSDVFITKINNKIVGYSQICTSVLKPNIGEIKSIYIHPELWNKGLGKDLCLFSLSELKLLHCTQVELWVLRDNTRACKFYESLGFTDNGTSRSFPLLPYLQLTEISYEQKLI